MTNNRIRKLLYRTRHKLRWRSCHRNRNFPICRSRLKINRNSLVCLHLSINNNRIHRLIINPRINPKTSCNSNNRSSYNNINNRRKRKRRDKRRRSVKRTTTKTTRRIPSI